MLWSTDERDYDTTTPHERGCQEAPPDVYGADVNTFGGWERLLRDSRSDSAVDGPNEHTSTRTHEHTSTQAHKHTSTQAHKHTSTQYPTYPAAEKPDHTRQHLPCRSTEIRHQHTPRCASLPRRPATQAPTVSSIIPAARTEARRTRHAAAQKTPRHEPARPNRRPLHPKNPMSPPFHRGRLHFEQALGGFATIDPSTGTGR